MSPQGVMPHPWWQFWQIGDFLLMLVVVVLFVRFMRRSDARARSEEPPQQDDGADALPTPDADAAAPREADGGADVDRNA